MKFTPNNKMCWRQWSVLVNVMSVLVILSFFVGDVVELSHTEGFVYSQSSVHVKVTVRPCHSEIYCCRIKYALLSSDIEGM